MELQKVVASYALILSTKPSKPVEILYNELVVSIDTSPKKSPKYKKVGKTAKALLFELVDSGCSIVGVTLYLNLGFN
jgi:hypothetical protein